MIDNLEDLRNELKDRKVVISMFPGELGWFLQYYQGFLRFLKTQTEYSEYDFIIVCNKHLHAFITDFVFCTVSFPDWFTDLELDQDCNEAVVPGSPPASLTPPNVYQNLILFMKDICKHTKEYELVLPPRGCNNILDTRPQLFNNYNSDKKIQSNKPIVTVFPRARVRAANRNVPEFVWYNTVMKLREFFTIVLAGTPSGACLGDLEGEDIINLIKYNEDDKTEKLIDYLNNSVLSVSSQSGGTHISLLTQTPSYIIGHERERHTVKMNRLNTPTSFRVVQDYRAIDADTIIDDLKGFIQALEKSGWFNKVNRPALGTLIGKKDLVGAEIGVGIGENAFNILQNLDIKKLYLIDPYVINDYIKAIGGIKAEESNKTANGFKNAAMKNLEQYKDKIEWIHDFSENAIDKIKEKLDFIYIDGDHNYPFVKKDIELYHPIVKEGGLISGHDFDNKGVQKAVYEFYNEKMVNKAEDDWWVIKPSSTDKLLFQDYNKLMEIIN